MSKPRLSDFNPRVQAQIAAQLHATPHPRTVAIETADEPATKPRARKHNDPLRFQAFLRALSIAGIVAPLVEHKFCPSRRWRFDFAWPSQLVSVECEGGIFNYGRHNRPMGFIRDCEKYSMAAEIGWRVLRYPAQHLARTETIQQIARTLGGAHIEIKEAL